MWIDLLADRKLEVLSSGFDALCGLRMTQSSGFLTVNFVDFITTMKLAFGRAARLGLKGNKK